MSFNEIHFLDFPNEDKFKKLRILHLYNNKMEEFNISNSLIQELVLSHNLLKKITDEVEEKFSGLKMDWIYKKHCDKLIILCC